MIDNKTYRERRDEILNRLHDYAADKGNRDWKMGDPYSIAEAAKALDDLVLEVIDEAEKAGEVFWGNGQEKLRQIITGDES